MTDTTDSDRRAVHELADALDGSEKSRRAGWALSFNNAEKLDAALQEVNLARADAEVYRKAASYLRGFIVELSQHLNGFHGSERLDQYLSAIEAVGSDKPMRHGRRDAHDALDDWREASEETLQRSQAKAEVLRERRARDRDYSEFMKQLAGQYHMTPSQARLCLTAFRTALQDDAGVGRESGYGITVAVRAQSTTRAWRADD